MSNRFLKATNSSHPLFLGGATIFYTLGENVLKCDTWFNMIVDLAHSSFCSLKQEMHILWAEEEGGKVKTSSVVGCSSKQHQKRRKTVSFCDLCVCCNSMMLSCKVVILWAKRDDLRNILQRQSYAFLRCASATYWPAKKQSCDAVLEAETPRFMDHMLTCWGHGLLQKNI